MSQANHSPFDPLPGLRLALDLARNQLAHHRRQSAAENNPDRYEDDCAGWGVSRVVDKLEAAIDEAKRQRGVLDERDLRADRCLNSVLRGGW